MNNFHRFQNFGKFKTFYFVFANLFEKATHVTLFWNLSRNPDKLSSKILSKMKNSQKMKKSEIHFSFAQKCCRFLAEILRLKNGAKECIV